jgi:hypothetical protein
MQVVGALIFELSGFFIHKTPGSNQWLFNCYLPFDCGLPLLAAHYFLKKRNNTYLLIGGYVLFLVVEVYDIYSKGINTFAMNAYITDSILLICTYLIVLYTTVMTYRGSIIRLDTFWLCLGIILFYGCNIPYFSMLGLMVRYGVGTQLFIILRVLNNVRYLFVAYSFYQYYMHNKTLLAK